MPPHSMHLTSVDGDSLEWSCAVQAEHLGSSWQSLDMVFTPYVTVRPNPRSTAKIPGHRNINEIFEKSFSLTADNEELTVQNLGSPNALQFLVDLLKESASGAPRFAKLLFPRTAGQILRSDILPIRLLDCEWTERATPFAVPGQIYSGKLVSKDASHTLPSLFSACAAGIVLSSNDPMLSPEALQRDLQNRLSIPWILPPQPAKRTLALVEGCHEHPSRGGYASSLYLAAQALNMNIVVFDNPGHWVEGPEYANWRADFIPFDLPEEPDAELANRIVHAIKACGWKIDGIMTPCEWYKSHVADACQRLGLPTVAPSAYEIATNKYKTSVFAGHNAHMASSIAEAQGIVARGDLDFPLILKPCRGWASEGVSLIRSAEQIEPAIGIIDTKWHGTDFVMEPYCAGPEYDINMVLLHGELLFFEICDDFPKAADVNGVADKTNYATFHELESVFPAALPEHEVSLIRDSFLGVLRRMGFHHGVFHVEGRIESSTVEYRTVDGKVDLHVRQESQISEVSTPPKPWLIEINPRPPGLTCSKIVQSTYGVDYWGLALLISVGDDARVRALSQPFANGPQYNSVMMFVSNEYDHEQYQGELQSEDFCAELLARRPDLAYHVSNSQSFLKRGEKVPHPSTGSNIFLGYMNVFSRDSRAEALALTSEVRSELRIEWK